MRRAYGWDGHGVYGEGAAFAVVVIGALLCVSQPQAPGQVIVRLTGHRSVDILATDGRELGTIYTTSALHLSDLTLSPSGELVSFLETLDDESLRRRLVVVDRQGRVQHVVSRDVRVYTWCCGERIAFIEGRYREGGGYGGFNPEGAYLVDPAAGAEERLRVPSSAYEVAWGSFDQSLYFKTSGTRPGANIVRYNLKTRGLETTTYLDLKFSPSGRHYLHYAAAPTDGVRGWQVIERETGRQIPNPGPELGGIEGWIFGEGDYLQLVRVTPVTRRGSGVVPRGPGTGGEHVGYTVFDVNRRSVAARIDGTSLPNAVAMSGALPVVVSPGRIQLLRKPQDRQ